MFIRPIYVVNQDESRIGDKFIVDRDTDDNA